jgi:hypothetical protein
VKPPIPSMQGTLRLILLAGKVVNESLGGAPAAMSVTLGLGGTWKT